MIIHLHYSKYSPFEPTYWRIHVSYCTYQSSKSCEMMPGKRAPLSHVFLHNFHICNILSSNKLLFHSTEPNYIKWSDVRRIGRVGYPYPASHQVVVRRRIVAMKLPRYAILLAGVFLTCCVFSMFQNC